ncbi:hypothetical protein QF042_002104 [Pedobacter sp. W3I1]|nr:hypothetical protein [Pedobacter sp. W3I1]
MRSVSLYVFLIIMFLRAQFFSRKWVVLYDADKLIEDLTFEYLL